ncbi:MAG: RING finger protein [Acutalibacteraceae bacterium]|nr:RING finger protein [Acutalibacteraceae bacterium]
MENYIGKTCPFCKTEIKEGDAVKVCPACDIPHHEGCWQENKGCTTFGCSEQNGTQVSGTTHVCNNCGGNLEEGQIFCPFCGKSTQMNVSEDVSDAISKFNQDIEKNAKKKKKKSKLLMMLLLVIVVIGVILGAAYMFFNSKVENIIDEIKSDNVNISKVESDYKSLTPVGQMIFREKILDAFIKVVSENEYTSTTDLLVNETALDKYSSFQKIAQIIEITQKDGTNVMEHISTVLTLEQYEKYNDIRKCIAVSGGDYADCLEYITDALESSTYYIKELYIDYAHSSVESALSSAELFRYDDVMCTEYVASLEIIEEELADAYTYIPTSIISPAVDGISSIVTELQDAEDSVESIEESIPKIN